MLVPLSAEFNIKIAHMDGTTADLNSFIDTDGFMESPKLEEMLERIAKEEAGSSPGQRANAMSSFLSVGDYFCKLNVIFMAYNSREDCDTLD